MLKNHLLQNQKSFWGWILLYSIRESWSAKFVQMMILGWPLTFLQQGQICIPIHLFVENAEKSFSQNVLMLKHFSYNQNFPWVLSAFACGLFACIKLCNL